MKQAPDQAGKVSGPAGLLQAAAGLLHAAAAAARLLHAAAAAAAGLSHAAVRAQTSRQDFWPRRPVQQARAHLATLCETWALPVPGSARCHCAWLETGVVMKSDLKSECV